MKIAFKLEKITQGTGSWPLPPNGWHFLIRRNPIKVPCKKPYFLMACLVYSEQDGVKRQEGGSNGEIPH